MAAVNKKVQVQQPVGTAPTEKFTFFYASSSQFSQFYPRDFIGIPLFGKRTDPIEFFHCEQWMMFNKALLFGDTVAARKILRLSDPRKIKAIGRKVKRFDQNIWNQNVESISYTGNRYKFTQHMDLLEALKSTKGTTLVEASPRDTIYGIGLNASNPKAKNRATWRGTNILGEVLTRLRHDIC